MPSTTVHSHGHRKPKDGRALHAAALALRVAFFLAVIVCAVVAVLPKPSRPILVPGERSNYAVIRTYIDAANAANATAKRELAEDAKIERELAAIRASLDHVTVHVHLPGCPGVCEGTR